MQELLRWEEAAGRGSREPTKLRGEGRGRQGMPLVIAVLSNIDNLSYLITAEH